MPGSPHITPPCQRACQHASTAQAKRCRASQARVGAQARVLLLQATAAQLLGVERAAGQVTAAALGQLLEHTRRGSAAQLWRSLAASFGVHFRALATGADKAGGLAACAPVHPAVPPQGFAGSGWAHGQRHALRPQGTAPRVWLHMNGVAAAACTSHPEKAHRQCSRVQGCVPPSRTQADLRGAQWPLDPRPPVPAALLAEERMCCRPARVQGRQCCGHAGAGGGAQPRQPGGGPSAAL